MAIERVGSVLKKQIARQFGTDKVEDIPPWCLKIWQLAGEWEYKMHSNGEGIDRKHWPVVGMLAELNKKYEDEIAALKERLAALEPKPEPEPESPKVDLRTKEGRAMKAQLVGA